MAKIRYVWAIDDGEHVLWNDLNHFGKTSVNNMVGSGNILNPTTPLKIFGGKNETIAFQLILENGTVAVTGVTVTLTGLTATSGSYQISNTGWTGSAQTAYYGGSTYNDGGPAATGYFDYIGRHIEMFVEHYTSITSNAGWGSARGWSGSQPADSDAIGWKPDLLIPIEAPSGDKGTHYWNPATLSQPYTGQGGQPFSVAASRNQGVWIDVYTPTGAPAGVYEGQIIVKEDTDYPGQQATVSSLPIQLRLYNFTLPNANHVRHFYHISREWPRRLTDVALDSASAFQAWGHMQRLAHRHRTNMCRGRENWLTWDSSFSGYYAIGSGSWYSPARRYYGPGQLSGENFYIIGIYDQFTGGWVSGFDPATKDGWTGAASGWEVTFTNRAPATERAKYHKDEPLPTAYADIRTRASWINAVRSETTNPASGMKMFCAVSTTDDGEIGTTYGTLSGYVNIWAQTTQSGYWDPILNTTYFYPVGSILGGYIPSSADIIHRTTSSLSVSSQNWIYNGTRPHFGVPAQNTPAIEMRSTPWVMYRYKIDGYFQWISDYWAGPDSAIDMYKGGGKNPWRGAGVCGSGLYMGSSFKYWGFGGLMASGEDDQYAEDDRGVFGPIWSVRLKNWRRGVQDYEYMWSLSATHSVNADSYAQTIVPSQFGTTTTAQKVPPSWPQRSYLYEKTRLEMAVKLDSLSGAAPSASAHRLSVSNIPTISEGVAFGIVTVSILDTLGNLVTTATNTGISIGIKTNPGSSTLSGTTTVSSSNGIATFSGLVVTNDGDGYVLTAFSNNMSLVTATSNSFNVTATGGLSTPTLVSPPNGAKIQSSYATFYWSDVSSTSYTLDISPSADFSSTNDIQSYSTTTNEQLVNSLSSGQTYYWRVRAADLSETTDWSSTSYFTSFTPTVVPSTGDVTVYSGSLIFSGNTGSTGVTFDVAIDPTRSFLVYGLSFSSVTAQYTMISGRVMGDGSIQFNKERTRFNAPSAEVYYYLVTSTSGSISAQQGTLTQLRSSASVTSTVSKTINLTKAIDITNCGTDGIVYSLGEGARTTLSANSICAWSGGALGNDRTVEYQIVEFANATVQRGDFSFAQTLLTGTSSLTAAVSKENTWLIMNMVSPFSGNGYPRYMPIYSWNNSSQFSFRKFGPTASGMSWRGQYYAVEFTDGTRCTTGSAFFANDVVTTSVAISLTTLNKAFVVSDSFWHGRGGESGYTNEPNIGLNSFTLRLDSTSSLTITRGCSSTDSGATARVNYTIVEFPTTNLGNSANIVSTRLKQRSAFLDI